MVLRLEYRLLLRLVLRLVLRLILRLILRIVIPLVSVVIGILRVCRTVTHDLESLVPMTCDNGDAGTPAPAPPSMIKESPVPGSQSLNGRIHLLRPLYGLTSSFLEMESAHHGHSQDQRR
jgi:hypothetical protein